MTTTKKAALPPHPPRCQHNQQVWKSSLSRRRLLTHKLLAEVEQSPLEQTISSTAQPASSPQQVTSTGCPSPTASSNKPAVHGTHTSSTLPEQSETTAAPSLWDRAYVTLRKEDKQLVDNYEKLLSKELLEMSTFLQLGYCGH
jgi:hypothetical protein